MEKTLRNTCLERLLSPVDLNTFVEQYWEQDVLHIARDDRNRYSGLLSMEDIESMLSTQSLGLADAQLSAGAASPPPEDYLDADGRIVARRLLDGHRDGATLVLSQAQQRFTPLADFCRQLQAGLAMRCQTNAYLSPAGQQGFRPHYDSHDVFILQVQGRKIFHFYDGGPNLPSNHQRFDASRHLAGEQQGSVELNAGDALYIPRGIMHDAVAHPDSPSLHLTVGLFAHTLINVLREVLARAETDDVDLRTSIPGAFDMARDEDVHRRLRKHLDTAYSADRINSALHEMRNDLASSAIADCRDYPVSEDGQGSSAQVNAELSAPRISARLERWHDIENRDGIMTVRTAGAALNFREPQASMVNRLAAGETLAPPDGHDDEDFLSLVRTLDRYGLIRHRHWTA